MTLVIRNDLTLVVGDFNAVSGVVRDGIEAVVGPCGSGTANDNSERLINFRQVARLRIAGSWFKRKDIHRLSWFSVDGRTCMKIDHILVNRRWKCVHNCRVYRSLQFDSDHRPVISSIDIRLRRTTAKVTDVPRYNITRLNNSQVMEAYSMALSNRFDALGVEETASWDLFKETINDLAGAHIGTSKITKKECISDVTHNLIIGKRQARLQHRLTDYKQLQKRTRASLRRDKQAWADGKATEAELALQKGQLKDAFANFRNLKAFFCHISTPILDNNGNLVSDKKGKLARWNEYCSQLLNRQPVPPSMLRLRNDLYCVEWGVKLYSLILPPWS